MRILHSHDPEPQDARHLTSDEISAAITRTHERMLDALSARLTQGVT